MPLLLLLGGGPVTINLGLASETDTAAVIAAAEFVHLGLAIETDTAITMLQAATAASALWTYRPDGIDRVLQMVFESLVRWLGDEGRAPLAQSPDGRFWRIHVANDGTVSATQI